MICEILLCMSQIELDCKSKFYLVNYKTEYEGGPAPLF